MFARMPRAVLRHRNFLSQGLLRRQARQMQCAQMSSSMMDLPRAANYTHRLPAAWSICAGIAISTTGANVLCEEEPRAKSRRSIEVDATDKEQDDRKDPLTHCVRKLTVLPLDSMEVITVARDISRWSEFMPCCSESRQLGSSTNGRQRFLVHFGMKVGRWSLGNRIIFEVAPTSPGKLELTSVNNERLSYVDDIRIKLTAVNLPEGGSELRVEMTFHARNQFYLKGWESIEGPLVEMIASRLRLRAMSLASVPSISVF